MGRSYQPNVHQAYFDFLDRVFPKQETASNHRPPDPPTRGGVLYQRPPDPPRGNGGDVPPEGSAFRANPKPTVLEFPWFYGAEVDEWISQANNYFQSMRTPLHLKVKIASQHLWDDALKWYEFKQKNREEELWPWTDFVRCVVTRFSLRKTDDHRTDLGSLKHVTDVESQVYRFNAIHDRDVCDSYGRSCYASPTLRARTTPENPPNTYTSNRFTYPSIKTDHQPYPKPPQINSNQFKPPHTPIQNTSSTFQTSLPSQTQPYNQLTPNKPTQNLQFPLQSALSGQTQATQSNTKTTKNPFQTLDETNMKEKRAEGWCKYCGEEFFRVHICPSKQFSLIVTGDAEQGASDYELEEEKQEDLFELSHLKQDSKVDTVGLISECTGEVALKHQLSEQGFKTLLEDVDVPFAEDRELIAAKQQLADNAKGPVLLTSNSYDHVLPNKLHRDINLNTSKVQVCYVQSYRQGGEVERMSSSFVFDPGIERQILPKMEEFGSQARQLKEFGLDPPLSISYIPHDTNDREVSKLMRDKEQALLQIKEQGIATTQLHIAWPSATNLPPTWEWLAHLQTTYPFSGSLWARNFEEGGIVTGHKWAREDGEEQLLTAKQRQLPAEEGRKERESLLQAVRSLLAINYSSQYINC